MKIKIPFFNKQIILDPVYEGLFMILGFYALFALTFLSLAAFGVKNLLIITTSLILVHMIKTSKIEKGETQ
jgi:uncharacterized membrane protein YeiB